MAAFCFVGEYFFYEASGVPPWMKWIAGDRNAAAVARGASASVSIEPPSASRKAQQISDIGTWYQVDSTGWMKKKSPDGYVYECVPCENQVEIAILFGPEMDAEGVKKYQNLESKLSDSTTAKDFATRWVEGKVLSEISGKDPKVDVERAEVGKFFNIDMIQYMATVDVAAIVTHETGFIGLQQSHLAGVTLNYLDGSMNDTASEAITHFFGSLDL